METLRISAVPGNGQRLDGGAMFGNAPRALWARLCPPDEEGRITLACRALLVETPAQRVLLETGIGAFFPPELRARYGVLEERHVLLDSLAALGLSPADITDIVVSHLHFDHAGGLLCAYDAHGAGAPRLAFPRARVFVSAQALERAQHPHARDRASFIPELLPLLQQGDRLQVVTADSHPALPRLRFHLSHGHTPGLLLTEVQGAKESVLFVSDLAPGTPWVHLPMTMGYDRYPELLIDEKTRLLEDVAARRGWLFYTHDPSVAMSRVARDPKGRMTAVDPQAAVLRREL